MKQKLTKLKGEIDNSINNSGDYSTPLTIMDRKTKQKIKKETKAMNNTISQTRQTDIYRTLYPTVADIHSSQVYVGQIPGQTYWLDHKTSLNKFKTTEIMQSIFYHNGIKLESNNRRKNGKSQI